MRNLCLSVLLMATFAANTDSRMWGGGCKAVNCAWGSWGPWHSCAYNSGNCGSGTSKRIRPIRTQPSCGGSTCSGLTYSLRSCSRCCPVNCAWGSWGSWGICSFKYGSKCGIGTQKRRRSYSPAASCGGSSCSGSKELQRSCSRCCPINCAWGYWGSWGTCAYKTGSCGPGAQTRRRLVVRPSSCGGSSCSGSNELQRSCSKCCRINCAWGKWGSWGTCAYKSGNCGTGTQKRRRSYSPAASCGGSSCSGSKELQRSCSKCCPINCAWGNWGSWGTCAYKSGSCGSGTQTRRRSVSRPSSCGGSSCSGSSVYQRSCGKCCPVNCVWGSWGAWGACSFLSGTCGFGNAKRSRSIRQQASCGGTSCYGDSTSTHVCHKCCPQNCKWSSWGPWSECSKECGGGTKRRSRTVTSQATCGGSCGGKHEEASTCNTKCCPVDCEWGPWGSWGKCKGECPGKMRRCRKEKTAASCGGTPCSKKDSRERRKCKRPC